MTLTDRFLRAKHWQLFLLCFLLIAAGYVCFFWALLSGLADHEKFGMIDIQIAFGAFFTALFVVLLIVLGWLWCIAVGLNHLLPSGLIMPLTKFKIFMCIPIIHLLCATLLMLHMFSLMQWQEAPKSADAVAVIIYFILLFLAQMVMIAALLYCHYFVAKTIKSIQLQREAIFSEYLGEFLVLLFYPIALWVIQPQVNRLIDPPATDGNAASKVIL